MYGRIRNDTITLNHIDLVDSTLRDKGKLAHATQSSIYVLDGALSDSDTESLPENKAPYSKKTKLEDLCSKARTLAICYQPLHRFINESISEDSLLISIEPSCQIIFQLLTQFGKHETSTKS